MCSCVCHNARNANTKTKTSGMHRALLLCEKNQWMNVPSSCSESSVFSCSLVVNLNSGSTNLLPHPPPFPAVTCGAVGSSRCFFMSQIDSNSTEDKPALYSTHLTVSRDDPVRHDTDLQVRSHLITSSCRVSRVYEHCAHAKLLLSHTKHALEFKSMFHMTSEMRLTATSDATARSSIPFYLCFPPHEIYFS